MCHYPNLSCVLPCVLLIMRGDEVILQLSLNTVSVTGMEGKEASVMEGELLFSTGILYRDVGRNFERGVVLCIGILGKPHPL